MIRISTGADLERFLSLVLATPERYAQIVICSPFIDTPMIDRLVRLAVACRRARCGLRVITCPSAAMNLCEVLPGHPATWHGAVIARAELHAKVYLAIARTRGDSEVIVTSANLTEAGVNTNIEFGVQAKGTSEPGCNLLWQVSHFLHRLAAA